MTSRKFSFFIIFIISTVFTNCKKESGNKENNWIKVNTSFKGSLLDIQFLNKDTGYILGLNTEIGNRYNVLLKTINGGTSWSIKPFPEPEAGGVGELFVLSSSEIYAGKNEIFKTTDEGTTWVSLNLSFSSDQTSIRKIHFLSRENGIVLKGNIIYKLNNNVFSAAYIEPSSSFKKFQDVSANVFLVTAGTYPGNGILFKSTDGGNNWKNIPFNKGFISSLFFIDENVGYVIVKTDIFQTVDGGTIWNKQNTKALGSNDGNICFFNKEEGYYVTTPGEIYYTNDEGKNWKIEMSMEGTQLNGIVNTMNKIICIGTNGTILIKK